jgi:hypothetical protein
METMKGSIISRNYGGGRDKLIEHREFLRYYFV